MTPNPFRYRRVSSANQAIEILTAHQGHARALAGGHSLLPMMKRGLLSPEVLVDLAPLDELRYVRLDHGMIAIGAMSRWCDLERDELVGLHAPLLAAAAGVVGDRQVRHRGTAGGSLAHADPAADFPAVLLVSDGVLTLRGVDGTRHVPAADFFLGPFRTAMRPGELLVEIRLPKQTGIGWAFERYSRRAFDWATVGVAVIGGAIGLINMGEAPLRARAAEIALAAGGSTADAAELAADGTNPPDEPDATAEYRRHVARVLTARALERALSDGRP